MLLDPGFPTVGGAEKNCLRAVLLITLLTKNPNMMSAYDGYLSKGEFGLKSL
jgi:hypothetical protein